MPPDTAAASAVGDCEVMAAVDGDDEQRLIIAEVCRDEAWLSASLDGTLALADWR